ncbi:DM13 domain-containing protein [Streptomyces angustmyceticus]|uniref:DM13 domain-containing protein n=1 Tax=Streptomyces angustmyceticus TaxID=285578 RepID=UPI0021B0718C|nr:DM13 domain-containing protein [Streptomyces angustmyceticus]
MSRVSRRIVVPLLLGLVVAAGIGLYLFQPWKAFTDTTVNESLPTASAPKAQEEQQGQPRSESAGATDGEAPMTSTRAKALAEGHFVTHEHDTSGTARTVRLADGGQVLRLEGLKTSEGPDVRVYLSPRAADSAKAGLGDGAVELGKLKGNLGNQNYSVPAGTDLSTFRSAVIWCARFSVSFGAADLAPVTS